MLRVAPVIFLAFWSGGYSAGKIGVAYASPMTLLVVRYAIVLLLLAPLLLWKRPPLPATRAQWVHLAAVGVLIQGCYFALVYVALSSNISSAAVAMIVSLQPILVALAAPQLAGEEVSRQTWLGLGLGLLGAVLVILARSRVEAVSTIGVAAAVAALACITAGALAARSWRSAGSAAWSYSFRCRTCPPAASRSRMAACGPRRRLSQRPRFVVISP